MERGLQDAFFSPSPILGERAGGEVSESPEVNQSALSKTEVQYGDSIENGIGLY